MKTTQGTCLVIILSCLVQPCYVQVTVGNFYKHLQPTKLKENSKERNANDIKYPHWADSKNEFISFVESGIVRLGSFEGINTCDVLVLATAYPVTKGGGIEYEEFPTLSQKQITKFQEDIKELPLLKTFLPKSMFLITWSKVEFYSGHFSTFQVALGTNYNKTVAIIQIESMTDPTSWKPQFYPELDVRFAYDQGTKFMRHRFLTAASGQRYKSGTSETAAQSTKFSNSKLNGRWVIDLSANPNEPSPGPSATSPPSPDFKTTADIGVSGTFVFEKLTLDGNIITESGDNNEISVILSKKDTRFNKLDSNIVQWLSSVYTEAAKTTAPKIVIIDYKPGSLVVEYTVEMPNNVCDGKGRTDCIKGVEDNVKKVSKEMENVQTDELKGELDDTRTEFMDLDECRIDQEKSDNMFCDVNAYCYNYPNQGSYACLCMDGFEGDGKVGNCKRINNNVQKTIGIIAGVVAAILIFLFILMFVLRRAEVERMREKKIEAVRIIPRDMRPSKKSINKPKARSTRKVLLEGNFGDEFEVYHRT